MISEVKTNLINTLEEFCPNNVFLQGTLNSEQDYPQKFITFFISETDFDAFYDNAENETNFYISVIFYSSNPAEVSVYPEAIMQALRSKGFILEDAGNDIASGVDTHTGWAMDFIYSYRN